MAASTLATVVAGTAAAAAYLNAKYHFLHDVAGAAGVLNNAAEKAQKYMAERERQGKLLVYHYLEEHATSAHVNAPFLEFQGRSWTYGQFYADLQRVGRWLMDDLKIKQGEMVAIDGPNSAEYLLVWFAVDAIGGSIGHINCNLSGAPLIHSLKVSGCRYLLAERDLSHLIEPSKPDLVNVDVVYYDQSTLESLPNRGPIPKERNNWHKINDVKSLIYTSGTTGLPKGVMILCGREINTAFSMATYLKLKSTDKFYTCLPLYHGAAQGLCVTPVIFAGASLRLGRKFSHKTFWPEVSESGANILQYVGELCRYLVNAPPHPLERAHRVQMAWGNGLRPDTWEQFRQRFNIPVIHELYAATDGLGASFSYNRGEFTRGAIGLRGWLWHLINAGQEVLVKIDPDTEDIIRNKDGFVIKVDAGEPGEVLHKVEPEIAELAFRGYYNNKEASEKRWMRDVFQKGDLYFRSGDLLRVDKDGRVYFVDRLGDTYRWHSENVSTNEVADVLSSFHQIAEAAVYGVSVPHADGRCGCATVVPSTNCANGVNDIDFAALGNHLIDRLPRYAVPIFLRFAPALSYTGTFKIQKGQAKREGINVDLIEKSGTKDRLFWLPPGDTKYQPYTRKDWDMLKAGKVKL